MNEQNQDIKADAGKLRLTLVPREIIRAIARARMYGLKKYGDSESWRDVSVERYRDAVGMIMPAYAELLTTISQWPPDFSTAKIFFSTSSMSAK